MLSTGTLIDEGMVYFDARLARHFPTVEVRVADVCLRVHDAVLLASLVRALVETAAREWQLGKPPVPARLETLNLAYWRASRSGLDDELIHPVTGKAAPAENVLRALLRHIGDALDEAERESRQARPDHRPAAGPAGPGQRGHPAAPRLPAVRRPARRGPQRRGPHPYRGVTRPGLSRRRGSHRTP